MCVRCADPPGAPACCLSAVSRPATAPPGCVCFGRDLSGRWRRWRGANRHGQRLAERARACPEHDRVPDRRSNRLTCDAACVTTPDLVTLQANSFGAAAQEYERGRPSYPDSAINWLLPADAPRGALDLGAGTGQLSRQLAQRGLDVVAVEPSAGMRAELTRVLPHVQALAGSAEQIPLADNSVDVVLVAQAWHWVDVARAVPEVARVLTPGGRLGLLWNVRDEREDWVARLGQIMHRGIERAMNSDSPQVGEPFGRLERLDVEWTYQLSKAAMLDLVASRSYVITLTSKAREAPLGKVRVLLDTHPALEGRDHIDMPYVTRCSRATLSRAVVSR